MKTLQDKFNLFRDYYEGILSVLYSDEGTYTKKETLIRKIDETNGKIAGNNEAIEKIRDQGRDMQVIREGIQNNYNKGQYDAASMKAEINKLNSEMLSAQEALKTY